MLYSAGASHLRIWEIDAETKKMTPRDCNLGKLRRCCEALVIHAADEMVYCGTQSGKNLCLAPFAMVLTVTSKASIKEMET